jgi:hypothetical protein
MILALSLLPLTGQRGRPSITEIRAVEKSFDTGLVKMSLEAPMELLGATRGVYLDGYGAVFMVELNLLPAQGISPFRPTLSKEDVARVRAAKVKRLEQLRGLMKDMMVASAGSLDRLPPEENLVLGVALFYNGWEDATGLPHQVTMQAKKGALVEIASNRQPRSALATVVKVREE